MFSVEERDRVRDHVLNMARADSRVVAGAVLGALAHDGGDRWSDLDLTFGVADDVPVSDVLADWTRDLADEFDAVHLFDLGDALVRSVERGELLRALGSTVAGLQRESAEVRDVAAKVEAQLRELASPRLH